MNDRLEIASRLLATAAYPKGWATKAVVDEDYIRVERALYLADLLLKVDFGAADDMSKDPPLLDDEAETP
jgi:hypothetical protein